MPRYFAPIARDGAFVIQVEAAVIADPSTANSDFIDRVGLRWKLPRRQGFTHVDHEIKMCAVPIDMSQDDESGFGATIYPAGHAILLPLASVRGDQ